MSENDLMRDIASKMHHDGMTNAIDGIVFVMDLEGIETISKKRLMQVSKELKSLE